MCLDAQQYVWSTHPKVSPRAIDFDSTASSSTTFAHQITNALPCPLKTNKTLCLWTLNRNGGNSTFYRFLTNKRQRSFPWLPHHIQMCFSCAHSFSPIWKCLIPSHTKCILLQFIKQYIFISCGFHNDYLWGLFDGCEKKTEIVSVFMFLYRI